MLKYLLSKVNGLLFSTPYIFTAEFKDKFNFLIL